MEAPALKRLRTAVAVYRGRCPSRIRDPVLDRHRHARERRIRVLLGRLVGRPQKGAELVVVASDAIRVQVEQLPR
jgi:hypothetical protein